MDDLSIEHFSRICRFCLLQCEELKMISDLPSVEIFKTITGIESPAALPQNICSSCAEIFEKFSGFIEKWKSNFNKLITIFEQANHNIKFDNSDNDTYDCDLVSLRDELSIKRENETHERRNYTTKKVKTDIAISFKCEGCRKVFPNEELLIEHNAVEKCVYVETKKYGKGSKKCKSVCKGESKVIICKNCKQAFNTKAAFKVHKDVPCEPLSYKCSLCTKIFQKQHRLNIHMRSHTKEAPFECIECKTKFRFQQNLRRHVLIHKGVKKFKCEDCGKAFSRAHVLNEHRNIHTGNNPYICDYCGKGFKRYANHFIHVYRHKLLNGEVDQTEDKKLYLQLQCNVCNKVFASRGGLENHLMLHQEEPREKKFLCTDCGKGFHTSAQLASHMRMHTGDRPFECNQCGKKFKQKSAYSTHQLVHSGQKPFQCKQCERLFTQSGHLKVHMRVHSGEKPFSCNFCEKKFALKSNLTVHTRTHTGEKPYVCSVCDKGHYDSSSLKKHMKVHEESLRDHGHIESRVEPLGRIYCASDANNEELLEDLC